MESNQSCSALGLLSKLISTPNAATLIRSSQLGNHFLQKSFRLYKTLDLWPVVARMSIEEKVKELVNAALKEREETRLSHVARKCKVDYDRLWRFMHKDYPDYLQASDAQAIYETLTGQPLIPSENEL